MNLKPGAEEDEVEAADGEEKIRAFSDGGVFLRERMEK